MPGRTFLTRILWGTTALAIVGIACGLPSLAFAQQKAQDKNFVEKFAEYLPGSKFAKEKGEAFGNWGRDQVRQIALAVLVFVTIGIVNLLYLLTQLIDPLLIGGSFLTNPLVQGGWPFVLGIANLGFVLALLFIAALTILGLGGFNIRQALVRLLIAAVLINFSLLIAGIILDASRLLMAVILKAVGDVNAGALGIELLRGSKLFQNAFSIFLAPEGASVSLNPGNIARLGGKSISVADALLATWLAGGVTIIFAILVISLLTRWLMLVFLLIVSPLAYLAYATPKLDKYARQWWHSFFSYVIYGPVVAFILAVAVRVGDELSIYLQNAMGGRKNIPNFASLIVTLGVIFLATRAGKLLGLAGAEKITGTAMAMGGWARRHPFLVGAAVAGPAGLAAVGGAKVGVAAVKGTVKFGKGVADEAIWGEINKKRDAFKKVAAGTAEEKDYKELEKSDLSSRMWRGAARVVSAVPGFGGTWGVDSKMAERGKHLQNAENAIAGARARVTAGGAANLGNEAALDHRTYLGDIDHNLKPESLTFLIEQGMREGNTHVDPVMRERATSMVKLVLQDPGVVKQLRGEPDNPNPDGLRLMQTIEGLQTDKLTKEEIVEELERRLGRAPTNSEIAAEQRQDRETKGRNKAWSDGLDKGLSDLAKKG